MQDWDLTSIGLVLIGSSITVAGTIIGVMLLGVRIDFAPFLLLTTAVLIVLSAALIVYQHAKKPAAAVRMAFYAEPVCCQDLQCPDREHLGRAGKDP